MKNTISACLLMLSFSLWAQENTTTTTEKWTSARPDGHAPIGVMGDHQHGKGEIMFGYRFMTMKMEGLRNGSSEIDRSSVYQRYMVTPEEMTMRMHMISAMYAPSDRLTLMAMLPITSNDMDLRTKMGRSFNTFSSGLGDVSVSALYRFFNKNRQELHGQFGFVLPTGSIEEMDHTPASEPDEMVLPYPMQTGTGSISTKLSITYLWQTENLSGGVQGLGLIRLNDNEADYRFGNTYALTSWVAYKTGDYLSFSARTRAAYTEEIKGVNSVYNPMMVTTADTDNQGGFNLDYGFGVNFLVPKGTLKDLRFSAEIMLPAYQEPNGIQLENNVTLTFGTQYAF